jgi:DNA-binding LytR/AlgR family response regulator
MHSYKHILIVEDEILIAKQLKKILVQNEYDKVSIAISYEGALDIIATQNTDLVLLDIKISGEKTGIDIAKDLNQRYNIPFIFLTSFNDSKTLEHVLALKPVGYINKPINRFTLISTINLFFNDQQEKSNALFAFKNGSKVIQINLNKILYIESDHIYITLYFIDKTQLLRSSLSNFMEMITNENIVRINRSTAVNLNFIEEFNKTAIRIRNKHFKISEKNKNEIMQRLNQIIKSS